MAFHCHGNLFVLVPIALSGNNDSYHSIDGDIIDEKNGGVAEQYQHSFQICTDSYV
jgi:hypothetical protein